VVTEEITKVVLSNSVLHNSDSYSMGEIEIDKYGLQQCFSMKRLWVLLKGSVSSVDCASWNMKFVVFRFFLIVVLFSCCLGRCFKWVCTFA